MAVVKKIATILLLLIGAYYVLPNSEDYKFAPPINHR